MQGAGTPAGGQYHEQPAGVGEGLAQARARLQGGFGAAARAVVLAPAASVRSGDACLGAVSALRTQLLH